MMRPCQLDIEIISESDRSQAKLLYEVASQGPIEEHPLPGSCDLRRMGLLDIDIISVLAFYVIDQLLFGRNA